MVVFDSCTARVCTSTDTGQLPSMYSSNTVVSYGPNCARFGLSNNVNQLNGPSTDLLWIFSGASSIEFLVSQEQPIRAPMGDLVV
jgi:hypothetical protein